MKIVDNSDGLVPAKDVKPGTVVRRVASNVLLMRLSCREKKSRAEPRFLFASLQYGIVHHLRGNVMMRPIDAVLSVRDSIARNDDDEEEGP